ncbi:MAG TPA: 30S ribosomal protein S12 methylthiotransferase RimO [Jatrophihabitans sp.]|nr:30S ribosomal protein S12 methylthiotransferase RimO [Jatrophihabitans sp.]
MSAQSRSVAIVTLGCARNEVDSEELAGRLNAGGWALRDDAEEADVVLVNTCGFIESAKKDSIDTLLAAADTGRKVVAVGCLAERYGDQLANSLPEADAVLGFDSYADIAARLDDVTAGRPITAHVPRDRRTLLPVTPVHRPAAAAEVAVPGHAWLPGNGSRNRLDDRPVAYLKLASGCDRRCTFCAIPSFRGTFVSRPPEDVLAEAKWLAAGGAREIVLVSENSTSYGKDLGDLRALEALLPQLAGIDGVDRIRVSYLQPAELRPALLETIATTPGVAPYFDLSFQHASAGVLRRMKRFGGSGPFLELLARIRELAPDAGARSNFIVGFPGETEADLVELETFLSQARLDAVGVFGYSDEEGTAAVGFADKVAPEEVAERVERITMLAEEVSAQRAEDRIGTRIDVLVDEIDDDPDCDPEWAIAGRAAHQGPDTDGVVRLVGAPERLAGLRRGALVEAFVRESVGVDLVAEPVGRPW